MNVNEIATKGDIAELKALLLQSIKQTAEIKAVSIEELKYVSIPQAALITGHHETTIHSWIKKGRVNADGSLSYLKVKNWTTEPRILLQDLLDFGERYKKPKSKKVNNVFKK